MLPTPSFHRKLISIKKAYPNIPHAKLASKIYKRHGIKLTPSQLSHRWRAILRQAIQGWTQYEDQQILSLLKSACPLDIISEYLNSRTTTAVRDRVVQILLQTIKTLQQTLHIKQKLRQPQIKKICQLLAVQPQCKDQHKIRIAKEQLIHIDINNIASIDVSKLKDIYKSIIQIKSFQAFIHQWPKSSIQLKYNWSHNQEKRLYQLLCIYGKNFTQISNTIKQQNHCKQKIQRSYVRGKTIQLLKRGLSKFKRIIELKNIKQQFYKGAILTKTVSRELLALKTSQSLTIVQLLIGLNFKFYISDEDILYIIDFIKCYLKDKQRTPSQRSNKRYLKQLQQA